MVRLGALNAAVLVALAIGMAPSPATAQRSNGGRAGGARSDGHGAAPAQPSSGPIQPGTPGSAYRTSPTIIRPVPGRGLRARGPSSIWWWGWNAGYPDAPETFVADEAIAAPQPARIQPPAESSQIQPLPVLTQPQVAQAARGNLQLAVEPSTAQVYVDGFYVGTVEDIAGARTGLGLGAGWHRLEFRAPGYITPAVNVTIEANRTFTYRAALRPIVP